MKSGKFTHHECCDCSLVHRIDFKLVNGELHEQWIRDEKETRKARKKKGPNAKAPRHTGHPGKAGG